MSVVVVVVAVMIKSRFIRAKYIYQWVFVIPKREQQRKSSMEKRGFVTVDIGAFARFLQPKSL